MREPGERKASVAYLTRQNAWGPGDQTTQAPTVNSSLLEDSYTSPGLSFLTYKMAIVTTPNTVRFFSTKNKYWEAVFSPTCCFVQKKKQQT